MATLAPCESMQIFIEAVKKRMADEGITKAELCRRSGITPPRLTQMLAYQRGSANLATCDAIAKALETTTSDLLRRE